VRAFAVVGLLLVGRVVELGSHFRSKQ
jgi:hypothetical protein